MLVVCERLFVVITFLSVGVVPAVGAAPLSPEEFFRLSDVDKRVLLASTLDQRADVVANLELSSSTHLTKVGFTVPSDGTILEGVAGEVVEDISRYDCLYRRRDGNFWARVTWYLPDDDTTPNSTATTVMDRNSGVSRSFTIHRALKGSFGAIDTKASSVLQMGQFHYWFADQFEDPVRFPFPYPIRFLRDNCDAAEFQAVDDAGETVRVAVDYRRPDGLFEDRRVYWLQPQYGFVPLRMYERREFRDRVDGPPKLVYEWNIQASGLREESGVWFPTRLIQTTTTSRPADRGKAAVYESVLSDVSVGTVEAEDMEVPFPDGTEVLDTIRNESYVVGQGAAQASSTPMAPVRRQFGRYLLYTNLALAAFVIMLWLLRRKWKQTTS